MNTTDKPFYSVQELADLLACSRQHVVNLEKRGILKPRFLGARKYFLLEEVIKAMTPA